MQCLMPLTHRFIVAPLLYEPEDALSSVGEEGFRPEHAASDMFVHRAIGFQMLKINSHSLLRSSIRLKNWRGNKLGILEGGVDLDSSNRNVTVLRIWGCK